jgi:hypothetical protein
MPISTIDQTGLNAPLSLTSPTLSSPVTSGTPTGVGVLTSGTSQASTSGTSIDFTSIPSWVKRITVMFQGVSTNGTSVVLIRIGSGSVSTSGYLGAGFAALSGNLPGIVNYTNGFGVGTDSAATYVRHGSATLTLITGNTWVCNGAFFQSDVARVQNTGGSIALGGTLDRVSITTVNGTDTFDAGTINILYE